MHPSLAEITPPLHLPLRPAQSAGSSFSYKRPTVCKSGSMASTLSASNGTYDIPTEVQHKCKPQRIVKCTECRRSLTLSRKFIFKRASIYKCMMRCRQYDIRSNHTSGDFSSVMEIIYPVYAVVVVAEAAAVPLGPVSSGAQVSKSGPFPTLRVNAQHAVGFRRDAVHPAKQAQSAAAPLVLPVEQCVALGSYRALQRVNFQVLQSCSKSIPKHR